MSRRIESDIYKFTQKGLSASAGLQKYLPIWRSQGLSLTDVNIICHFLYRSGALKEILLLSIENLEKDEPVSWYYLGQALTTIEPNLKRPVYEALKAYISDHRKLDEFTVCHFFDKFYPDESELKLKSIQSRAKIMERHRQTLLDQIRLFNQSRNYNIEKQTIQKFIKFFPNDKTGKEFLMRFEDEELQRFIQRYRNERTNVKSRPVDTFTPDQKELLELYFLKILQLLKQTSSNESGMVANHDNLGYVFFFIFLEDYQHALQLMPYVSNSPPKDWLHLELLVLNQKFAETLAYLKYLDAVYGNDPSYYTAKVYYTAQCFWGLGERKKAIELMESLFQIKPDYRLASALLKDWRTDL